MNRKLPLKSLTKDKCNKGITRSMQRAALGMELMTHGSKTPRATN